MPTDFEVRNSGRRQGRAHLCFQMSGSSAGKTEGVMVNIQSYVWILGWSDAKKDKDCSPKHLYMAWLPHNTVTSGKSNFLLQFRALSASVSANMEEIPLPFMTLLRNNGYFCPPVWLKVVTTSPDSERAHKTLLLQEEYQRI